MTTRICHALARVLGATAFAAMVFLPPTMAAARTATSNLSVSATVAANCTISTAAVNFGSYDPVSGNAATPLDGTGTVTVNCTLGSVNTITLGQGSNADAGSTDAIPLRRMADGGDYLSYSLFQDTARTVLWGNTEATGVAHVGEGTSTAITVYGQVPPAQNVSAGTCTDTVVATVTF